MMDRYKLYQDVHDKWGQLQLIVVIEELSELQKEICKDLRGQLNLEHLYEEIADVEIMVEQLKTIFSCNREVEKIKQFKLDRLQEKVNIDKK